MKLWEWIKSPFRKSKEKHEIKRKEKMLIRTEDDKVVVDALPAEEDNSAIDIHKIVENMENPEKMAEVVENNLEEIIEQDMVKDTMKHLDADDAFKILDENRKTLTEHDKIKNAIEAIRSNSKKLKAIVKNSGSLSDFELAQVLVTLKPEKDEKASAKLEEQKIVIVSNRIIKNMKSYGGAWHLEELTKSLEEESKLSVITTTLDAIDRYAKYQDEKKSITSNAKVKLVSDLLDLTNLPAARKDDTLQSLIGNGLTAEESAAVVLKSDASKAEKAQKEMEKQAKLLKERLKRETLDDCEGPDL